MGTALLAAARRRLHRSSEAARDESGFMLVEVLVATMLLTVAISALLATFFASAISLHVTDERGTAVTLGESQMEIYRTVSFTGIRIDGTLIPTSGSDPYNTGHTTNSTIPPSSGQALAGQDGDNTCPSATLPAACEPVQDITGPDGYPYIVETYVDYVNDNATFTIRTPASGLNLKLVTVVVLDGKTDAVLDVDTSAFVNP
jgi:type II secretory pathway pseudopilin PulG